jgi:hypothetical protein
MMVDLKVPHRDRIVVSVGAVEIDPTMVPSSPNEEQPSEYLKT